jgi:D-arabinose 1-dehydrogenase-like Zn-dependent alcohol dehydrogenase
VLTAAIDERGRGAMRGIVFTGDEAEVTDELGVRDPGPNEVRVAIGAAGVCHSDESVEGALGARS